MPKLGEFIGALLSDAVQARVRADLEAVRIAEAYSSHELLRHLPVPRFRLPDITVEVPVLVASVEGLSAEPGGRSFGQPTPTELAKSVREGLSSAGLRLAREDTDKVVNAVVRRATRVFEAGPQILLSPASTSTDLAASAVTAIKTVLKRDAAPDRLEIFESATKASLTSLLSTKLVDSPYLEVIVTSGEIKSHGDDNSVVHVRLNITEDAYEVINRDDRPGFYLTPE